MSDQTTPAYEGHEFVIVLREGKDAEGAPTLEMAAAARPEPFNPGHPVHAVGAFIAQNMAGIAAAAAQAGRQLAQAEVIEAEPAKLIGPDRERTLILPS